MASTWKAYNDLAWTEDLLADPAAYEDEVNVYIDLIKRTAAEPPRTLLHLGSGAGGHDTTFKRHFTVTGVDLSLGMLNIARARHPEIEYLEGDMRTLRLDRQFDVVAIPDSIDYMASEDDLRQAIQTMVMHLKTGGVFLVVGKTEETFQNNNFAYTGEKDGIHVTLLENNYINPFRPNTYEAFFVFLIRREGELTIHSERQILGLFSEATWEKVFNDYGLVIQKTTLNGIYDNNILGEGEYPLTVFFGKKS
ncbi:MAG: class I SAM-dependent methyltransferase [Candidatus Aminicenantes bacterium]|nr:class I SAM-dependent methyltransferase [Candidatus Aminicenantes bacterium]